MCLYILYSKLFFIYIKTITELFLSKNKPKISRFYHYYTDIILERIYNDFVIKFALTQPTFFFIFTDLKKPI